MLAVCRKRTDFRKCTHEMIADHCQEGDADIYLKAMKLIDVDPCAAGKSSLTVMSN